MARYLRSIHERYISPVGEALAVSATLNKRLWTHDFATAWESLRLDEKVIWIAFIANTICVLTLIEVMFLKI